MDYIKNNGDDFLTIKDILTFTEASEEWGLDSSTLRKVVKTNKLTENIDYRKSGKVWLITREAMIKLYGDNMKK